MKNKISIYVISLFLLLFSLMTVSLEVNAANNTDFSLQDDEILVEETINSVKSGDSSSFSVEYDGTYSLKVTSSKKELKFSIKDENENEIYRIKDAKDEIELEKNKVYSIYFEEGEVSETDIDIYFEYLYGDMPEDLGEIGDGILKLDESAFQISFTVSETWDYEIAITINYN